ncbi:MAG: carbonic anhydrase [Gammaproteobacteria bacterium]|nr:carbonic anhydrase [Gammaproteobacteria bacterium]
MMDPDEALKRLCKGNKRFLSGEVSKEVSANRKQHLDQASGQKPFAIILACSDSRVPVELIFDCGIGDLFVIRVAGNIASSTQIGSIEYAVTVLGTRLIVVLGHSNCGAVIATIDEITKPNSHTSPNLRSIIDNIRPALELELENNFGDKSCLTIEKCVQTNIKASVTSLENKSTILKELIAENKINVVGAEYSLETGSIKFISND